MDSGIIKMKSILEAALDLQKEKGWVSEKDIKLIASIFCFRIKNIVTLKNMLKKYWVQAAVM